MTIVLTVEAVRDLERAELIRELEGRKLPRRSYRQLSSIRTPLLRRLLVKCLEREEGS